MRRKHRVGKSPLEFSGVFTFNKQTNKQANKKG